jgi:hypothetical protein
MNQWKNWHRNFIRLWGRQILAAKRPGGNRAKIAIRNNYD